MKKRNKMSARSARTGEAGPVLGGRITWNRKPMTQVVMNKKAEQRRTWCRKGTDDGAFFIAS
ncbi:MULTISPECIES: hypothetical protein [Paenibacillus]|uniref:Uncharacterized protein n=1 Tax=Paenibacillus albilobatus TaxID=2716884 RepID=A0A920C9C6_9BACL|nr:MULTISPECIES: hypothetical protein [Paenibacillus]MDR9855335.1 hypothetical protein [Paenibacillus sp. VCA1]GIO29079.1 hypothetical protein J2TS6_02200 [Paenibacillus albilobatus]